MVAQTGKPVVVDADLRRPRLHCLFDLPGSSGLTETLTQDESVLARQTDGVLLITEAGKTRRVAVARAMANLQQVGVRVVGRVLNTFAPWGSEEYYYGWGEPC